jgi:hypothetical protein
MQLVAKILHHEWDAEEIVSTWLHIEHLVHVAAHFAHVIHLVH